MYKAIEEARQSGHNDDDILSFMMSKNPDIEQTSQEALKSGYDSSQILDYIAATTKEGNQLKKIPKGEPLPKQEHGFISGIKSGFKRGATGLIAGADEQLPRDEGFFEHLGALGGELFSDIPAIAAGSFAGGSAGLVVGGPVAGAIGAGAGGFATPAIIKQAYQEYREHVRGGLNLTFGEFLERVGRVGATGLKSGIVGAATSQASRLLPVMRNMPGLKKLLSTHAGKTFEKPIATLAAITGSQAIVERKIPSVKEIGDNIALTLGFHVGQEVYRGIQADFKANTTPSPEVSKHFKGTKNKAEFKQRFKDLVKKHHPDIGGDQEVMKVINEEYSKGFKKPGAFDYIRDAFNYFFGEEGFEDGEKPKPETKSESKKEANFIDSVNDIEKESLNKVKPKTKRENLLDKEVESSKKLEADIKKQKEQIAIDEELRPKYKKSPEDLKLLESVIKDKEKVLNKKNTELEMSKKKQRNLQKEIDLEKMKADEEKIKEKQKSKVENDTAKEKKKIPPKPPKPPKPEPDPEVESRKILEDIIDRMPNVARKAARAALKIKDKFKRQEKFLKILRGHVEKMRSGSVESQFKWKDTFANAEKKHGKQFTKKEREEMIYYRQKTGNPNVYGDTFEKLSDRLPKEAKEVTEVVRKHTDAWLKRWNDNPVTRNISPREGLEEIYLPGLYEEPKDGYKKTIDLVSKQFKVKNPLSNQKIFLSYNEALKEAGLKPKFKDLGQLMQAYDEIMLRMEANSELLERIKLTEKKTGEKLIVTPGDGKLYNIAKKSNWTPFHDVFLRQYKAGKTKEGEPIRATYAEPALMDPDMASVMRGMFKKDAFKPESNYWKWYDVANNTLKTTRIVASPFHYFAIAESGLGSIGVDLFKALPFLNKLFPKNWWDEGTRLRNNKEFMIDAIKYVEVGRMPDHEQIRYTENILSKAIDKLPNKMLGIKLDPVYDTLLKSTKFLFNEFHPRIKLFTWNVYVNEASAKHVEKGIDITPEVLEQIKRDCGDLVNNQFGGQIKELSRIFNDPKQRKWIQRFVGYPDWSISAAKQAAGFFGKGVKGDMARAYWIRYGLGFLASTAIMKFIMGGFQSKDDEENKVRWNPEQALKAWEDDDPTKWMAFPLPDLKLKIGKVEINPGRDEKGRKRYAHFGKQALEIPRYFTNFTDALFSKSSPLIQETYKQMGGSTPFQGEPFPVRGVYVNGSMRPWDGSMKGTEKRVVSRFKTAVGAFVPFGLRTVWREGSDKWKEGLAVWAASGLGAIPVGKGLSLRKSESYIFDALKAKNIGKLNKIVKVLKENGYAMPQIKRTITMIRKFHLEQKKANKK